SHFTPSMEPNAASVVNAETEGKRRMRKPERRKSTLSPSSLFRISSLGIPSSFVIRHSDFVTLLRSLSRCGCRMVILHESFSSVRGYGLRAYEPRQGRNAATVV